MIQRQRQTRNVKKVKPIPRYYRLQDIILRNIERGSLSPGSSIPPERRLAESYSVSIGTAKKAILNLVNEGYLYRIQGKGTFVAGTTLRRDSLRYYRFLGKFEDKEKDLSVHLAGIRKISSLNTVNSYLRIRPTQKLFELKRIFFSKETPVVFVVSYLPVILFPGIDAIPVSHFEQKTLYGTIEEKFGLPTIYNQELIGARFPSAEAARLLKIGKKHPILFIEMLAFTYRNRPYEYRRAYCLTDSQKIFRHY
ncbi:MAG: GntR family transcriptional regulator [Desulfobacterales bacterium]|jgi:GntR family transcriptional regulator|nr:GntR family transcriptional regulator [Desulfobacterales bacterium]